MEHRMERRYPVTLGAQLMTAQGRPIACRIVDMSRGGLRLHAPAASALASGTVIDLHLLNSKDRMRGLVLRQDNGHVGVMLIRAAGHAWNEAAAAA